MKSNLVSYNSVQIVPFKGIRPPYKNLQGYSIIPIAQDPSQEQIENSIKVTESGKPCSGMNGDAFMWGQDLVVKKYKPQNGVTDSGSKHEIETMDSLYERRIELEGSQKGLFAFTTPQGNSYFVSTQVQGDNLNGKKNNLNKENLSALVDVIGKMDEGNFNFHKNTFSLERPMHYDLSRENIKVTHNTAGIFDFEFLNYENLNNMVERHDKGYHQGANYNLSDVPVFPSNLRTFECRALLPYLLEADNPKELFNDYLKKKSNYHEKLASFYLNCSRKADKNRDSYFSDKFYKLAEKEYIHDSLLTKISRDSSYFDIKKAEAMKIQMANFIFDQSPDSLFGQINPEQISQYLDDMNEFFTQMYSEALCSNDSNRKVYYSDCLELTKNWQETKGWMDWQMQKPKKEDWTPEDFEKLKSEHELFMSKIIDKQVATLDEIVL